MKRLSCFLLLLAGCGMAFAQEVLTAEDAIKIGLERNYSVLVARNGQQIAHAQNNFGAAGMSPTVSLNGALNLSNLNSHQEFNTGVVQDRPGAKSNALAASVNANWTVFDGLRMFAIKKRLELNEGLSLIQTRQQMEAAVYDILSAYYSIVRINALLKASRQNLRLYEERRKVAQTKSEIGSESKVDLLLSQSDENQARGDIMRLEIDLLTAKANLNTLLARPVDTEFQAQDTIVVNYNPGLDELKRSSADVNSSILASRQSELIFAQTVKEARSANLPFIQLLGAYNFTRNQSQAGIVFLNRQNGLSGGVSATWLLFNGNRNNRLVKERTLQTLNQNLLTQQTIQQVDAAVYVNFKAFQLNKQILELEAQSLRDASTVQLVSLERYKLGKSGLLETIETQKNLEDAQLRYFNALYAIKLSEIGLLRANGALVK